MYHPQLLTFLTVVKTGSFTKTAEELMITSTAVMKQINAFERRVGVKVFERRSTGATLTEAGQIVYKRALEIVERSEQAVREAQSAAAKERTVVRVGSSILNPCRYFTDVWRAIAADCPGYTLRVVPFNDKCKENESVIDGLGKAYDLFVGPNNSSRWLAACNFYRLRTFDFCIAAPSSSPLCSRKRISLDDLHGETLLLVSEGDSVINDAIRRDVVENHPQIRVENAGHYFDERTFNACENEGKFLITLECWKDVHPSLTTLEVNWKYKMPFGIIYQKNPSERLRNFIKSVEIALEKHKAAQG